MSQSSEPSGRPSLDAVFGPLRAQLVEVFGGLSRRVGAATAQHDEATHRDHSVAAVFSSLLVNLLNLATASVGSETDPSPAGHTPLDSE